MGRAKFKGVAGVDYANDTGADTEKQYSDIGSGIGVIYGQSVSPQVTPGGQTAQIPNDGTIPSAGTSELSNTYPYPKSQWPRQDENAGAPMPKLQAQGDPHVLYGVENKPEQPAPNNSVTQPGMDRTVVGDKWQPQYQTRMYIDNGQDYMNSIPGHWDLLDRALGGRGYTRNILDDGIPPRRFINQQTGDTAEANVMDNNFIVVQFYDRSGALLATTNTFSGLDGFLGERYPYSGAPGEAPSGDALYKPSTQNGQPRLTEEEIYAIKSLIKAPERHWRDAYKWPQLIVFDWNGTIDVRGQAGGGIPWSEVQKLIDAGKKVIIFTSHTDQPDKEYMRNFLRDHHVEWTDDEKILDKADIFVGDKKSDMRRAGKHGPKYIDVREFSADKILAKGFKLTKDEEIPQGMGPTYLTLPSGTRVELMPQHGPTGEYLYHESQAQLIPLSDITVIDPNQPLDPQGVAQEVQSLQTAGVQGMKPVICWADGDGRPVQLTDGHHRYAAAKQVGTPQIPALILNQISGFQKHLYDPLSGQWVSHTEPAPSQMLGGSPGMEEQPGTHEHYAGEFGTESQPGQSGAHTGRAALGLGALGAGIAGLYGMTQTHQSQHVSLPTPAPIIPGGQYTTPPPQPGESHQRGGRSHSHPGGHKPHKHEMEYDKHAKAWIPKIDILKSVSENE